MVLTTLLLVCACVLLVAHANATHATTTPFAAAIYDYDWAAPNAQGTSTSTAYAAAGREAPIRTNAARWSGQIGLAEVLAAEEGSAAVRTVTALTEKQDQALNAVMRNPNSLEHIFGQAGKHNLAQLTQELGGERAVVREAILRVSNEPEGVFKVSSQIGSYRVTITGRMINGVPRISNIWVPR